MTIEHGFKSLWPAANKRLALFVELTINPSPGISAIDDIDPQFAVELHKKKTMAKFCYSHDQLHLDAATLQDLTSVISA